MTTESELDIKVDRLMRLAADAKLAGILLASQPAFSWLTGGGSNRVDGSREAGSGALFVSADGRRYVIANAIEMPRLLAEPLAGGGWQPVEYEWIHDHGRAGVQAQLARVVAGSSDDIGSDTQMPGIRFMDADLSRLRAPLTDAEVDRYRRVGADAGRVIGDLCRGLQPGAEELAIARLVTDAAASIGGRAIVVLVAADDRIARFRHPVPTNRTWRNLVMVVACVQRDGLVVALSRIVTADAPSDDLMARTAANAGVFNRLIAATRAGARAADLYRVAVRAYADEGFAGEERRHHQGGATGYRSREWIAHPASNDVVQARQAFAWNPSITGTKVEDTVLLTDSGVDLITRSPDWPTLDGGAPDILRLA